MINQLGSLLKFRNSIKKYHNAFFRKTTYSKLNNIIIPTYKRLFFISFTFLLYSFNICIINYKYLSILVNYIDINKHFFFEIRPLYHKETNLIDLYSKM